MAPYWAAEDGSKATTNSLVADSFAKQLMQPLNTKGECMCHSAAREAGAHIGWTLHRVESSRGVIITLAPGDGGQGARFN